MKASDGLRAGRRPHRQMRSCKSILEDAISDCRDRLKKVLLLIPDYTRYHSNGGQDCQYTTITFCKDHLPGGSARGAGHPCSR